MAYLLDVNLLVALIDPQHVFHERAHEWFATEGLTGWATCPITENGVLRVVGNRAYANYQGNPAVVAESLQSLLARPGHRFWPDDISLLDGARVDISRLLSAGQVTDSYLLALARAHGGKLATLDHRLVISAVVGGTESLAVIR